MNDISGGEPVGALDFIVLGKPAPQGSKVRTQYGGIRESNPRTAVWRTAVIDAADNAAHAARWTPPRAAVVDVTFCFKRPRSHYRTGANADLLRDAAPGLYHTQKPDGDKLTRALFDALTIAGIVTDDATIARCQFEKWWGERDYMAVEIWKLM